MSLDTDMNVVARRAPLGKWVVLALPQLQGAPGADASHPPGSEDYHDQSVVQTLPVVSLDYAADHLLDAVRSITVSEGPLQTRLQTAWAESVQHVWEKPCLTTELLARFKALWDRVTDPTAGPGAQGFGS